MLFPTHNRTVRRLSVLSITRAFWVSHLFLFSAESCMTDTAGFHFVVSTPTRSLNKQDRKAIKSHAAKANPAEQQPAQLRSWISPDRVLGSFKRALLEEVPRSVSMSTVPSPRRVGSDLSGLQLPPGVELYMVQDLVKCMRGPLLIVSSWPLNWNDSLLVRNSTKRNL